ncbi:hypothetical protein TSAR_004877 [Trichomalopsis sarcophagae]|uniref:Uncharacterized protein n=1 Tax=Trichomalopsis sarcophagae TaxID=543379 RepID=A0A232ED53_9HYME|nr:hypothetical protein TSAR_004877 [Trichomalopsis sarcophagae]
MIFSVKNVTVTMTWYKSDDDDLNKAYLRFPSYGSLLIRSSYFIYFHSFFIPSITLLIVFIIFSFGGHHFFRISNISTQMYL